MGDNIKSNINICVASVKGNVNANGNVIVNGNVNVKVKVSGIVNGPINAEYD